MFPQWCNIQGNAPGAASQRRRPTSAHRTPTSEPAEGREKKKETAEAWDLKQRGYRDATVKRAQREAARQKVHKQDQSLGFRVPHVAFGVPMLSLVETLLSSRGPLLSSRVQHVRVRWIRSCTYSGDITFPEIL